MASVAMNGGISADGAQRKLDAIIIGACFSGM
jgi:hypothetical protein